MNTISYKEVVKLIHPDHNSNVIDVGSKMASAKLYRDDEVSLYKLVVKWGVVQSTNTGIEELPLNKKDEIIQKFNDKKLRAYKEFLAKNKSSQDNKRPQYTTSSRHSFFRVGDVVYIKTKCVRVGVIRVTPKRVYYHWNGKVTYAAKKNVRFV